MKQVTGHGSRVTACATAVIALALTWHTVRATPMAIFQIKRKGADLEKLQALQSRSEQTFSAMKMLQDAGDPPALSDVLANRIAELRPREDAPLIEGWFLKSADVIFSEIALADAAGFMADAENRRPLASAKPPAKRGAWRVAECTITPGGAPGVGRVAMVMETLEFKAR